MFNDMMDEKRLVIEGTIAWNDNFRSLHFRNDTTLYSWLFWYFFPSACQIIKIKFNPELSFKSIL